MQTAATQHKPAFNRDLEQKLLRIITRAVPVMFLLVLAEEMTLSLLSPRMTGSTSPFVPVLSAVLLTAIFALGSAMLISRPLTRELAEKEEGFRRQQEQLRQQAAKQEFNAELSEALSRAIDEQHAQWVIQRAIDKASPDAPVELLLMEADGGRLQRALTAGSSCKEGFGCPVVRGGTCPVIRSGSEMSFAADDLGACRHLVEGGAGGHAFCVPVTINSRALGVLHTTRPADDPASADLLDTLKDIAQHAGIRLGLMRMMAADQHAATTDALTGLHNRRSLQQRVASLLESGDTFSVLMADIDHFKRLNDTYGHQVGDRALQAFAQVLTSSARPDDLVARLGGEEFLILLPRAAAETAGKVAERIRAALPRALNVAEVPAFTASFGIADRRHGQTFEALAQAADAALYAAKAAGRDRVHLAEEPLKAPLRQAV